MEGERMNSGLNSGFNADTGIRRAVALHMLLDDFIECMDGDEIAANAIVDRDALAAKIRKAKTARTSASGKHTAYWDGKYTAYWEARAEDYAFDVVYALYSTLVEGTES